MKKLIALLLVVSFVTINTASAFAASTVNVRDRVIAKRIENNKVSKPVVSRPGPDVKLGTNKPVIINRPNVRNNNTPRLSRPTPRDSYFNRVERNLSRGHNNRITPNYRHNYKSSNDSLTPLEFFGIGTAIIAIAAIVSSSNN